jgi:hypothetical protein
VSGHQIGVLVEKGGSLVLDATQLAQNQDMGLAVWDAGTAVQARGTVIRDSLSTPTGKYGWGVNVDAGTLTLEASVLSGNRGMGLAVILRGRADVKRSIIRDTVADSTEAGAGVVVQDGGEVVLESSVLTGNLTYGLLANYSTASAISRASVTASVIRDTLASAGAYGRGVQVDSAGQVQLTKTALVRNREVALSVEGKGSEATVEGSVLAQTLPDKEGSFGIGAGAQRGAHLVLKDTALVSSSYYGLFVADGGSVVELSGSLIRDTKRDSQGQFGRGINILDGGRLVMGGSALVANHEYGLFIAGADASGARSEALLSASLIRDTRTVSATSGGVGIAVQSGGKVELKQSALVANHAVGLYVSDSLGPAKEPCEARAESSLIGPTLPTPDGSQGAGVVCGAKLWMTSSVVTASTGLGIIISNKGSSGQLKGVVVDGTVAQAGSGEFGHALFGGAESVVEASSCELQGNAGGGLVFHGGAAVVESCLVSKNKIGVHVQGGSTLVEAESKPPAVEPLSVVVTSDTRFLENTVRVGSGVLPLPNPFLPEK